MHGRWDLGFPLKLVWFCLDVFFSSSSIMNLCVISVYRYLAIAYPYRVRYRSSKKRVTMLLCTAWGISLLVSLAVMVETLAYENLVHNTEESKPAPTTAPLPVFTSSLGSYLSSLLENNSHCHSDFTRRYFLGSTPFLIYGSLLTYFLPLGVMTFSGLRSIRLLKRQRFTFNPTTSGLSNGEPEGRQRRLSSLPVPVKDPEVSATMGVPRVMCSRRGSACTVASSPGPSSLAQRRHSALPGHTERSPMMLAPGTHGRSARRNSSFAAATNDSETAELALPSNVAEGQDGCHQGRRLRHRRLTVALLGARRPSVFAVHSKEQRAIRALVVVFALFVVCWFPFFIVQLIVAFGGSVGHGLLFELAWPGYVSSGINPFIYTIFHVEYKDSMQRMLRTVCCPSRANAGSPSFMARPVHKSRWRMTV